MNFFEEKAEEEAKLLQKGKIQKKTQGTFISANYGISDLAATLYYAFCFKKT